MNLKYQLGVDDFKATQAMMWRQVSNNGRNQTKLFLFNIIVWIPFGVAVTTFYFYFKRNLDDYMPLSIVATAFLLWIVLIIFGNMYKKRLFTNSMTSENATYCLPQTLETNSNGFRLSDSYFSTEIKSSSIKTITTDQKRVFMIVEPAVIFTIPTSAFENAEMQQEFIDTMKN